MKASVEFVVVVLSLCSVVIDCYKAARVILLAEFENTAMAASCPRTVVLWRRSRSAPGTLKMLNFDKFYQEDMRGQVPDVLLVLLKYLLSASIRKCPPPPPTWTRYVIICFYTLIRSLRTNHGRPSCLFSGILLETSISLHCPWIFLTTFVCCSCKLLLKF